MSQNKPELVADTGWSKPSESSEKPAHKKLDLERVRSCPTGIKSFENRCNVIKDARNWTTYKVAYLGYAVLDRRYTLPMLPWVIAEIKRHGIHNVEDIYIEVTDSSLKAINCESNNLVFIHKLYTISKFAQSSNDASCFTYMTREIVNGPCAYHVFQASDERTVFRLFTTLKEATKAIVSHQSPSNVLGSLLIDSLKMSCHQYEVLYLGRIKASGKKAPPTFIDDVVEKFRCYEAEKNRSHNDKPCSLITHGTLSSSTQIPLKKNVDHINGTPKYAIPNEVNQVHSHYLDVFNHVEYDYSSDNVLSQLSPIRTDNEVLNLPSLNQMSSVGVGNEFSELTVRKDVSPKSSLIFPSSSITHSQSLDSPGRSDIVRDLNYSFKKTLLNDSENSSGDISRVKPTSLASSHKKDNSTKDLFRPRSYTSPNPVSTHQQNRTMLFIIGPSEICLIGMDKKQMLLSKAFNDIAHCSQGLKHLDHFGFISRETALSGSDCYTGYIFRCQTEKLVDEIMATLKQAFKQAHLTHQTFPIQEASVPKIIICDLCPMQWFHSLCSDVEGLDSENTHLVILEKLGTLIDKDKETIMVKFQDTNFATIQDQNEVLMMLLREFCEQKQMKHVHVSHENLEHKNEEKHSKLNIFRQKAVRSLSNSFETFLKFTNKDDGKVSPVPFNKVTPTQNMNVSNKNLDMGFYDEERYTTGSLSDTSPVLVRPRSSTISSAPEKISNKKLNQQPEDFKKKPTINMLIKSGNRNSSYFTYEESPKGSWRQAIFHKVQTPLNTKHVIHDLTEDENDSQKPESRMKKSKEELRALWKKAIIEQILLIRMEKENKKLQINQDVASLKRMKLNYEEINPCLKSIAAKWTEVLNQYNKSGEVPAQSMLTDLVKSGVPRHKRGEIWQFLASCTESVWDNYESSEFDLSMPYDELLKLLTSHQHSILIDIGRTFPNHPFYNQSLGSGQLSLFNLLKAYSLMDKEVGYCQGISFVAGILLLHMPEENAFKLMTHLMINLGLRRQYKADMVAFQIQMYQLSRLVHDCHKDLYDHLEKHDVAPTLYAAPWFLTLFASQFPIGFVSRLFDLIFLKGLEVVFKISLLLLGSYKKYILSCESFESIMEYLKGTLPALGVLQMEIIFNQVFNLDISDQLHAYEVEYHVLLEEMMHSPSKNNTELENLLIVNKTLKSQNIKLMEQLQVSYSRIHDLEASEASLKSSVHHLQARVTSLKEEKEALVCSLNIMKQRLEKLEASQLEDNFDENLDRHPPTFGMIYAMAGSEKQEDENFKKLIKNMSQAKENTLG